MFHLFHSIDSGQAGQVVSEAGTLSDVDLISRVRIRLRSNLFISFILFLETVYFVSKHQVKMIIS